MHFSRAEGEAYLTSQDRELGHGQPAFFSREDGSIFTFPLDRMDREELAALLERGAVTLNGVDVVLLSGQQLPFEVDVLALELFNQPTLEAAAEVLRDWEYGDERDEAA
jgi:hypothetical protein